MIKEKIKNLDHRWKQFLIVMVIVGLGVLSVFVLVMLRRPAAQVKPEILAPLVKVIQLKAADIEMVVSGFGTVSPKVEVEIVPQVSGKVVSVHPEFKAGGIIPVGEVLIEIDPRDYELAVQQSQAAVAEAQVRVDTETAEGQIALDEWKEINPGTEPSSPLVLREPQIRQAQAKLESARAALETARLNLERTKITLPLDIRIVSESADLGQFVVSGRALGTAYAMEAVEIEVPLEDKELAWFDIAQNNSFVKGSAAKVKAEFAGRENIWDGFVARTTGRVDERSRLISVVVEVPNPFDTSLGRAALLPGIFAEVLIKGRILENAIAVPRDAVHNGNEVWIVDEGRVHIQPLDILRKTKDVVYATDGLKDGVMIITSALDVVTEGMRVRTKTDD